MNSDEAQAQQDLEHQQSILTGRLLDLTDQLDYLLHEQKVNIHDQLEIRQKIYDIELQLPTGE